MEIKRYRYLSPFPFESLQNIFTKFSMCTCTMYMDIFKYLLSLKIYKVFQNCPEISLTALLVEILNPFSFTTLEKRYFFHIWNTLLHSMYIGWDFSQANLSLPPLLGLNYRLVGRITTFPTVCCCDFCLLESPLQP
jgi:hypothetical protein